jgi:hypothetical protein
MAAGHFFGCGIITCVEERNNSIVGLIIATSTSVGMKTSATLRQGDKPMTLSKECCGGVVHDRNVAV